MNPTQRLHEAVRAGDLAGVRAAIATGADVNAMMAPDAPAYEGITPLIWAARDHGVELVRALIEAGAEVHAKTEIFEDNALHMACRRGDLESARLLLDAGIDPNQPSDDEGWSPLEFACMRNAEGLVDLLLGLGADVNYVDENGDTALFHAVGWADPPIMTALLRAGADPVASNDNSDSPTPLHLAAAKGKPLAVAALLDWGVDPNLVTDFVSPLGEAVMATESIRETITLLVRRGAHPDGPEALRSEETPLIAVARRGRHEAVQTLLDLGADPSRIDSWGRTALENAVLMKKLGPRPSSVAWLRAGMSAHGFDPADPTLDPYFQPLVEMELAEEACEDFDKTIEILTRATPTP